MSVELEPAQATEEERVLEWRFEELVRAGFGVQTALEVACARHVDLHDALGLVARGCKPETAAQIVL